jgi:hypothetical protein
MSATTQPQAFGGPPGPSSASLLPTMNIVQRLTNVNEQTWLSMGNVYFFLLLHYRLAHPLIRYLTGTVAELMNDNDRAMKCFENALRHNQYSIPALSHIASLCRAREQFQKVRRMSIF